MKFPAVLPAWQYGDPADHVKYESEKKRPVAIKTEPPEYMARIRKSRRIKELVKQAKGGR